MKKDIQIDKVVEVALAVAPEQKENGIIEYYVYLINLQTQPLEGLLVSSKGYGELNGKEIKTSVLRHFFELVHANSCVKIELIDPKLFSINNEYWISYWQGNKMFDKKYVFVSESILPEYFVEIPILGVKGVMIK